MGTYRREKVITNKCQCRKCGDIIESKHRHDFVSCKCGAIFTDGGLDYIRRGYKDLDDIIDMSEISSLFTITYNSKWFTSSFLSKEQSNNWCIYTKATTCIK